MPESKHYAENKINTLAFYGLLLATILLYLSQPVADGDLWGHLRYGLDFLQAGHALSSDIYSYMTGGHRWIDDSWLSEMALAIVYQHLSLTGLIIMQLLIGAIVFALLLFELASSGMPVMASFALMFPSVILMSQEALNRVQPNSLSYLPWMAELYILKINPAGSLYRLLLLPVIFMLWINLDSSAVAGLSLLYTWVLAEIGQSLVTSRSLPGIARNLMTALLSTAACLVTPYGSSLLSMDFSNLFFPVDDPPSSAHPLHLVSPLGMVYIALGAVAIWTIRQRMAKTHPVRSLALLVCLLLPLAMIMYLPMAVMAILLLSSASLAECLQLQKRRAELLNVQKLGADTKRKLAPLAGLAAVVLLIIAISRTFTPAESTKMPAAAVRLLQKNGATGNLACLGDWGEYCTWHLYPHMQVSVDNRAGTAYSKAAITTNMQFIGGIEPWDILLTKKHTDIVLTSLQTPNYNLMKLKPGWQLVYSDKVAAIFLPSSSPLIKKLSAGRQSKSHHYSTDSHS